MYTRFFCDISKFIVAVISEKPVAGKWIYGGQSVQSGPKVPF
jgi:hypothetical protein